MLEAFAGPPCDCVKVFLFPKKQGVDPWKVEARVAWEEQGGFHWIQVVLIGS